MDIQELSPSALNIGNDLAKRCPDYDDECSQVKDHVLCMNGSIHFWKGEIFETAPIEGFCPYVCGMVSKP